MTLPRRLRPLPAAALLAAQLLGLAPDPAPAQLLSGGTRSPRAPGLHGPRTEPGTVAPQRRRTGLADDLYYELGWQGPGYTNYARTPYERYRSPFLDGERFYDNFGAYVGQGRLIYDWTEAAPVPEGSSVDLGAEFTDRSRFSRWFSGILVSAASHGQYHTSLAAGDRLRMSFTPLTLSKPSFNGIRWDVLSDKYAATLLASRLSSPLQFDDDYGTRLLAAHGEAQVGDFARVGVTWASVHNARSDRSLADSPVSGVLTGPQNAGNVDEVTIVIADDSPETPASGAVLILERVLVDGVFHPEIQPLVRGGVSRQGFLEVSGSEVIELTYNIRDDFRPTEELGSHTEIGRLEFELVVANDYLVTITSNKQQTRVGGASRSFLPVARARGEVTDGSNQRFLRFAYGLPTAHEIVGMDFEVTDLGGLEVRGEYAVNRRYRRFPNQNFDRRPAQREIDPAGYLTALYSGGPWFVYGEGYNIDPGYSTTAPIADPDGVVDYHPRSRQRHAFELVDDNDDQDEFPDWYRRNQSEGSSSVLGGAQLTDLEVFPGLDQNNDYISDFNQNQNHIPDYAEPFLRFAVDPPEFLFGMDMNNNTIIDRFEDDERPDYPFEPDLRGVNGYLGMTPARGTQLTVGSLRERQLSSDRRSRMTYALLATRWEPRPSAGRPEWRVTGYAKAKRVRDDIPDDRLQWSDAARASVPFGDPLDLQDAVAATAFVEASASRESRWEVSGKAKLERIHQAGGGADGVERRHQWFLGLINRAQLRLDVSDRLEVRPRWKSTLKRVRPTSPEALDRRELTEALYLVGRYRLLPTVRLDFGVERTWFANLVPRADPAPPEYAEDFRSWVVGALLSNQSDYQGYRLTLNAGYQYEWQDFEGAADRAESVLYLRLYAGLAE